MTQNAAVSTGAPPANLAGRLFHVAWLAVLLGLAIQGLTLLTALGFGLNVEMIAWLPRPWAKSRGLGSFALVSR